MPRLTNREYLDRHAFLALMWSKDKRYFSYLSHNDQIYLHRYYSITIKESDADHIAHRKWISKKEPSLPHTSGRAYQKLLLLVREGKIPDEMRAMPDYESTSKRRITIRSVLRPEPDYKRLAKLIVDQVIAEVKKEMEEESKNQG